MKIRVNEEYGYRFWLWEPSTTNFEAIQKKFYEVVKQVGVVANPWWVDPDGKWEQVRMVFNDDAKCVNDYEDEDCQCDACVSHWINEDGERIELPKSEYYCHIHDDEDSYLVPKADAEFKIKIIRK